MQILYAKVNLYVTSKDFMMVLTLMTPIQDGPIWGCSRMGRW